MALDNTSEPVYIPAMERERPNALMPTSGGSYAKEPSEDNALSAKKRSSIPKKRNAFVRGVRAVFHTVIPYGGLLSSSFNLASATLGAGITSLPSAFNLSGIVMSTIYLVVVGLATVYSMNLLAKVIKKTGFQTYEEAAQHLLGHGVDYFLVALMVFLCFGGSVAYIIVTGALLTPVLTSPGAPEFLQTQWGIRFMVFLVWLFCMLPLVIPKRINSLRYCSAVGILCILYFVVCVVVHSSQRISREGVAEGLVYMQTGNVAIEGLSLFMFSYMCQMNAFEVFNEMTHRTVSHFTLYSTIAIFTCGLLYFITGLFGYLDWGLQVTDSILKLYDPIHEPMIAISYIGIVFKLCVAFALHLIPLRDAVYHCLRWDVNMVPYWKHSLVMTTPAFLALICGLFIPKVNTVLGLLGAFCGGTIGLIFPAVFYMYSGNFSVAEVGLGNYCATYMLLLTGVVAVVFGTTSIVHGTIVSSF